MTESTSPTPTPSDYSYNYPKTIGWIGLGAMGFPMALRIARCAEPGSVLYIYDIDASAMDRFVDAVKPRKKEEEEEGEGEGEPGAEIRCVGCAREVAESSVCSHQCYMILSLLTVVI